MHKYLIQVGIGVVFLAGTLLAQTPPQPTPPAGPVTLEQAVEFAGRNYPAIRASLAEVSAAEGEIDLAKTAYLPRTELLAGWNRATRNNVFGMIFPNPVIPPISGPVQDETTGTSTFGSAAGALFSWEPFDFGLRKANVEAAEALRARAQAGQQVTEYEVSLAAAEAYLNAVAHQQAVAAAQATVDRMKVFADTVAVLVKNELRPGADESRALAELAQARTDLIRAEELARQARATVAEWMGLAGEEIEIRPSALLETPPAMDERFADLERHPFTAAENADIALVQARRRALEKEWRPKFEVLGAGFGRGTGARIDGTFKGGAHGLAPSEGNWGAGFQMTFSVFDYKQNRVRRQIESHREETERAHKERVLQELKAEVARAQISVDAAREVAENTPVELDASQMLEVQAQARYRAGLGTVVEVAEAQRLLRQAEIDDSLARLGIWRALFALAAAEGEMEDLLNLSSQ